MAIPRNERFTARTGPKTRRTRQLIELAQERFSGCDLCRRDDSYNLIDDLLRPLSLRKRERTRLFGALSCPGCESRVRSGRWVLGLDRSELRRLSLSKKFDRLHEKELVRFRGFLVKHPMLGAEHPFGRMLGQAVSRAKKTRLAPTPWFRAKRTQLKHFSVLALRNAQHKHIASIKSGRSPGISERMHKRLPSKSSESQSPKSHFRSRELGYSKPFPYSISAFLFGETIQPRVGY